MLFFRKKKRERLENPDKEGVVGYWSKSDSGGQETHVMGEKYAFRGNPQWGALRALDPIKTIFEKIISSRLAKLIPYNVSNDKLSEPVQEIARVFDLMIEAEKLTGMKKRWENWKKVICVFLEHDMAYRYRLQWFLERLDKNKIKLLDDGKETSDKYFFRVKNFRVDLEEEWQEAFQKYPELKIKQQEFRDWLYQEDNWFKEDGDRYLNLEELFPKFLKKHENT